MRRMMLVLGVVLIPAVALAQQPAPPAASNSAALPAGTQPRYSFTPVEGGALKLDVETGKVSFCSKGDAGYACLAVPDSRDAYEAEIGRLQAQLDARGPAAKPGTGNSLVVPLPTQSDFDAALDYATRLYQRLRAVINGTGP